MRPWQIRRGWFLSCLLSLTACIGSDFPPEPSVDEEGLAVLGGLEHVASQSLCTDSGLRWSAWDGDDAPFTLGRSSGTAGVVSTLLEGAQHFARAPLSDDETDQNEPFRWLSLARAGADSLTNLAERSSDGSLSWPSCVPIDADTRLCDGSQAAPRSCSEEERAPEPGLATGVAGIGLTLLELSEAQPLWEPWTSALNDEAPFELTSQLCAWQQDAEAAGRWLLSQQCSDGGWALQGNCQSGTRATGLWHGGAGIGYFFLRLYERTGDPSWREAAEELARWLRLLSLDPHGDGLTLVVPEAAGAEQLQTGLADGNAGVAFFLLNVASVERADAALAAASGLVGEASLLSEEAGFNQALAEGIVAYLLSEDVVRSELTGLSWPSRLSLSTERNTSGTDSSAESPRAPTGVIAGQAGIGWALLQASRAGVTGALAGAEGSARWLSHALNAHYYQGRTWWPEQPQGWQDSSSASDGSVTGVELTQTGGPITWRYLPGLEEGMAGIAWFMRDLSRETGAACWEKLSDEAAHWLYLRGRPSGQEELWRWPQEATRQRGEDLWVGHFSPTLAHGSSGVTRFLAYDRLSDLDTAQADLPSFWGLRPVEGVTQSPLTCEGVRELP